MYERKKRHMDEEAERNEMKRNEVKQNEIK